MSTGFSTGGAGGAPKLGRRMETNASKALMSHSSLCSYTRPSELILYSVLPVYGLSFGFPGMLSDAANLHRVVIRLGLATCQHQHFP